VTEIERIVVVLGAHAEALLARVWFGRAESVRCPVELSAARGALEDSPVPSAGGRQRGGTPRETAKRCVGIGRILHAEVRACFLRKAGSGVTPSRWRRSGGDRR
jgi:hypothetical protein